MEETTVIENVESYPDYSLEIQAIQEQLNVLNDNVVILSEVGKGTNSITILILALFFIACIYRLVRFIF